MKVDNSKFLNRFISESRPVKNKLIGHYGHQQFKKNATESTYSKLSSKILFIKSNITSVYKHIFSLIIRVN